MLESLYSRENYVAAKKLLDHAELRHRALASNLANVETPGYKRVDVDQMFAQKLERAMKTDNISAIRKLEPQLRVDTVTAAVRQDGNNVSVANELMQMNKNALEYEYLTKYVSGSIKRLKSAITGKAS